MSERIKTALVSFWDGCQDPLDFICSGVFVGPDVILTVKHDSEFFKFARIENDTKKFIDTKDQGRRFIEVEKIIHHSSLDAALVYLKEKSPNITWLNLIDLGSDEEAPHDDLMLYGFFESHLESKIPVKVLNFRKDKQHWVTDVKQPVGHSGSPLCWGNYVWGIAYACPKDHDTHRGLVICIRQLHNWLTENGVSVVDKNDFHADLAQRIKGMVSDVFSKIQPKTKPQKRTCAPDAVFSALEGRSWQLVIQNLRDELVCLDEDLKNGHIVIQGHEDFVKKFKEIVGLSSKLCLDLRYMHGFNRGAELPTVWPVSISLVARPQPHLSWVVNADDEIDDENMLGLGECGGGDYRKNEVFQVLHKKLLPQSKHLEREEFTKTISGETIKSERFRGLIKGKAKNEYTKGRQQIILTGDGNWDNDFMDFLKDMDVGLVVMKVSGSGIFVDGVDEPLLLEFICDIFRTFKDPVWVAP